MEKRNVIEEGRTPELADKMAEAMEKTADNIEFDFSKEHNNEKTTDEQTDGAGLPAGDAGKSS